VAERRPVPTKASAPPATKPTFDEQTMQTLSKLTSDQIKSLLQLSQKT